MKSPRQSIGAKLLRVMATTLLVAMLFASFTLYYQSYRTEQSRLLEEMTYTAELLANRSVASLVFNDFDALATNISSAKFIPAITDVCVYAPSATLIAEFHRADEEGGMSIRSDSDKGEGSNLVAGNCPSILQAADFTDQQFIDRSHAWIAKPIKDRGEILGVLKVVADTATLYTKLNRTIGLILLILLVALIIALLLGAKLLKQTLRPLIVLRKQVTEKYFDELDDLQLSKFFDDEVGDLSDAFNSMLEKLKVEHMALQKSEEHFRVMAENSPVGIYYRNNEGALNYANGKWAEITGVDVDLSHQLYVDHISEENERSEYIEVFEKVIANNKPLMLEYRFSSQSFDNDRFIIEFLAPVSDSDGTGSGEKVVGVIGSVLDITDLKNAQLQLERLAHYDPLTTLPNRRFFLDHLQYQIAAASKHHLSFALVMIDLDNFKRVNDTLGHDAGDYLLKQLGLRLQENCFDEDVVSRLGGDEFIILLNVNSKVGINRIVERLRDVISKPVNYMGRTIEIRCSMGVAVFPDDAANTRDLLKNADIALYRAKSDGRDCMVYFSRELDQEVQQRVNLELKLQKALKKNQLELYLQPQVNSESGEFVWCEALLRWHDEELGFVSPAQFIPVAEESGLIVEMGYWVLEEACRIWSTYEQMLLAAGIEGISVNLSTRQFFTAGLKETSMDILRRFSVGTERISFEITESLMMENVEKAITTLGELRAEGFSLSMDDFGTGYSSLAYLKQFKIDYLKIDKSFVDGLPDDPSDMAITATIIAMAQQLGLGVVAEGIETEQQRQVLQNCGCELMQGYLFSKPLPVDELLQIKQAGGSEPFSQS